MPRGRMTALDLLYAPLACAAWISSPRARASMALRRRRPPPELPPARRAWIHGASVGEILSAGPVIEALAASGRGCALSCNTASGLEAAERAFPAVPAFAMPLDFSGRVRAALDRVKPSLIVLLELEIWPQLLAECARRDIPAVCVNARITGRSFRRYRLLAPGFGRVGLWLAQGEEHAARLSALGIPAERVRVIPTLKAVQAPPPRPDWIPAGGGPLLVAGSTHPGEEGILLEAWALLPGWRLLLAPRHPERFDAVAGLLEARGIPFARRSRGPGEAWSVCLLDTIGELRAAYAAADAAFVGGSLVPVGGHNVLEPAACGVGVIVGPHTLHVEADARKLETLGGLVRVTDARALAEAALAFAAAPHLPPSPAGPGEAAGILQRELGPLLIP